MTDSVAPQAEDHTNPLAPRAEDGTAAAQHSANRTNPWAQQPTGSPRPLTQQADDSTASVAQHADEHTALLTQLVERVEDLSRVIARQAATIERLADEAKARDRRDRAGADLPLVVDLFALHNDTAACAATAESPRERTAFEAIATRIERLIVARNGTLIAPRPNDAFDALTMEATDVAKTNDPDSDRTIESLVQTGLTVSGRSVRPASVIVRRYRPSA